MDCAESGEKADSVDASIIAYFDANLLQLYYMPNKDERWPEENSMKVALVSPLDIKYSYRGTEKHVYEYAKFLFDSGIDTTILISDVKTLTPHTRLVMQRRKDWRVWDSFYKAIPKKTIIGLKAAFPFGYNAVVFYKDLPRDSVIYLPFNVYSHVFNILAKPKNQRYVIGSHGMNLNKQANVVKSVISRISNFVIFGFLFRTGDIKNNVFYHVINRRQMRYLIGLGVDRRKIFHVTPFIDTTVCYSRPSSDKKLRVVHIGGIGKDAASIMEIVDGLIGTREINEYEFCFIGREEPEGLYNYVKRYRNIKVLGGGIDDKKKHEFISKMDVIIVPDRNENFPITILEGFASGLYVIASDMNPGAEDLRSTGAYLYTAANTAEYIKHLAYLLSRKKNKRLFDAGRKTNMKIAKRYDRTVVLPMMGSIFEKAGNTT